MVKRPVTHDDVLRRPDPVLGGPSIHRKTGRSEGAPGARATRVVRP